MAPEEAAHHRVIGERKRLVEAVLDPAGDHSTLIVDLCRRQCRPQRHVRYQGQERLPVARQRRSLDLGVVGVSGGAEAASHRFGGLRDVESRAACRALDEHLLQEVRDAGIVVTLPAAPHSDQHGNRHRRRRRVLLGEDDEAAVETLANPCRLGGGRDGGRVQSAGQDHGESDARHDPGRLGTRANRA